MTTLQNWTKETTATLGMGTLTLTPTAGQTQFSDLPNDTAVDYVIFDGDNKETGQGMTRAGKLLERSVIYSTLDNGVFNDVNPSPLLLVSGGADVLLDIDSRNVVHKTNDLPTSKGELLSYSTDLVTVPVGTDGQILSADAASASGLKWVPASAGGGSPLTVKGDLYGYDTGDNRLAVGINGQVLVVDSAEPMGIKWDTPPVVITDHTLLTNIGTNTHVQLDTHLADASKHFVIDDVSGSSLTKVFSTSKIISELATKSPIVHTHTESDITDLQSYLIDITTQNLDQLANVDETIVPTDSQLLSYNSTSSKWEARTVVPGSSSPLTSKGDLYVYDTDNNRLPIGIDGQVLVVDLLETSGVKWSTPVSGVTDHTLLTNIGTNTHVQLDTHVSDTSVHYTQANIILTESQISDLQSYLLDVTNESIKSLVDVNSGMTPTSGQVLTWDSTNNDWDSLTPSITFLDGGNATTIYLPDQVLDGGTA